jgi:hypothetical protein
VEDSGTVFQHVQDLKDDQLEHGARQGEVDAEDELNEVNDRNFFILPAPTIFRQNNICL